MTRPLGGVMRFLAHALWLVCGVCFFILVVTTTIMTCVVTYKVTREAWAQIHREWVSGTENGSGARQ